MGGGLLSKPWRQLPEDYEKNLHFVKEFKPPKGKAGVKHVRILLHGPAGAGKSAFINSVSSVFHGRMTSPSLADGRHGNSFTKKYTTYNIWKKEGECCSFIFNDMIGLEDSLASGVYVDDVKLVLKGHVRDGYKFDAEYKITEEDICYNAEPTINDRVHVLVSVIPADTVEILSENTAKTMREIRLAASDLGIPQMTILTKIDECFGKKKEELDLTYHSKVLKKKVDVLCSFLGIPPYCVFLVQNYHSETTLNREMNALLMFALAQMITFGEDFINKECVEETAKAKPESSLYEGNY